MFFRHKASRYLALAALAAILTACAHIPEPPRPSSRLLSVEEHLKLGSVYETKGELELALKEYEDASIEDPADAEAYFSAGNVYMKLDRLAEAEDRYLKAVALAPASGAYRNNLGWLYMEQGKYAKAEEHVREAMAGDPRRIYIYLDTLGVIQTRKGDFAAAEKSLTDAASEVPRSETDGLSAIYRHMLELYNLSGEPDKADALRNKINRLGL